MMFVLVRKIVVGAAGLVASYYASKWLEKLLEEKPLKDRMEDAKTKVIDLQVKALDKKDELVNKAKSLYSKPAPPAPEADEKTDV